MGKKIVKLLLGGFAEKRWGALGKTKNVKEFIEEKVGDDEMILVTNYEVKILVKKDALEFCGRNEMGLSCAVTGEVLKDLGEAGLTALLGGAL